jgi:glycosyltransferase involved in cell wall biosynthesis
MSRRFLMVSPYFVPMNYVGAKRSLHLARYLPHSGWEPAVYCMPEEFELDPALKELIPNCAIDRGFRSGGLADWQDRKAQKVSASAASTQYTAQEQQKKTLKKRSPSALTSPLRALKGLFSPFDRFTAHVPGSILRARRFLRAENCELIYANAGPFSAIFLADVLARLTKLPLVLDLRDPWTIEPNYRAGWTPGGRRVMDAIEARAFQRASKIILNTRASMDAYVDAYAGRIPAERFTFIRNQFDPELYGPPADAPTADQPFRVIYYGHLRPTKNAGLFLAAFRDFVDVHDLLPSELEFITLGEVTASDAAAIESLGLTEYVHHRPWLPFTESPSLLGSASVLLDLMGPNHHLQISGKIYDYLASGRPILSVSPCTELDEIFNDTGAGERVNLQQREIAEALSRALSRHRSNTPFSPDKEAVSRYTARPAAEAIAHIFDEVIR